MKNTIVTTTIDCNGTPLEVPTKMEDGESWEDLGKRHEADVAAAKAKCESSTP